jgi:hypothetical protein
MSRRRRIVVPKDKESQRLLDVDEASPEQLIDWLLTEEEHNALWAGYILDEINKIAGTIIDDFEEDRVTTRTTLGRVLTWLDDDINPRPKTEALKAALARLTDLFNEAHKRDTSVHFFF